jgi:hypothetical protein
MRLDNYASPVLDDSNWLIICPGMVNELLKIGLEARIFKLKAASAQPCTHPGQAVWADRRSKLAGTAQQM